MSIYELNSKKSKIKVKIGQYKEEPFKSKLTNGKTKPKMQRTEELMTCDKLKKNATNL